MIQTVLLQRRYSATPSSGQDRHFRLRLLARIAPGQITGEQATLLCDLGAGIEELPPEVMVVDHHLPAFEGKYHANPRRIRDRWRL